LSWIYPGFALDSALTGLVNRYRGLLPARSGPRRSRRADGDRRAGPG